jgi:hypothetical protein
MSQKICLFPTFSQKENQTTNHCLLILKMIYEENPKFLSEILSVLLGEGFSGTVGVQFMQQQKGKKTVPDGEITQEPFSIFIETKLGRNFGKEQLLGHLETLKDKQGQRVLIALGNFEQDIPDHSNFKEVESSAKNHGISFVAISFEQLIQAIQLPLLSKNLTDAVSDLGEYLDKSALLPSWKYRLDVVNCRVSFDSVFQNQVYTCPAKGGQYNHRRSSYFGTYRNKCVEQIAAIEAVVDLESKDDAKLVWRNDNRSEAELVNIAIERRQQIGESFYPARVFILGHLFSTNFSKASSGGMQGSKQYFDIGNLDVKNAEDLAIKLRGKTWENYEL